MMEYVCLCVFSRRRRFVVSGCQKVAVEKSIRRFRETNQYRR